MVLNAVYINPKTKRPLDVGTAPVYSALFGFFYFARHGVWKHAWRGAVLAVVTGGMSWLIYPIYAEGIMRRTLISRNWTAVPSEDVDRTGGKFIVLMVTLLWTILFCVVVTLVISPDL